ncbi:SPW repeat protein [Rhizobium jaguaris]|uniref:SPW repeat protein n=1 Tax=Rhizobium jaguaris TaxID=1312183 RepID=UPI0039BF6C3B
MTHLFVNDRIAALVATWLATSPWVLGFGKVPLTSINAIACGVLVFSCSAWIVAQREQQPVRVRQRR